MSTVFYDREDVTKWLGARTVDMGREYVDAVANLHWNRNTLSGEVQGTQRHPYVVDVKFHDIGDDLWVEGSCSCPVGFQCKHMAAVLIAALDDTRAGESVRPELVKWLESLRAHADPEASEVRNRGPLRTHALVYQLGWSRHLQRHEIQLFKARLDAEGEVRSLEEPWSNVEAALIRQPKFVSDDDLAILRSLWLGHARDNRGQFIVRGANGGDMLNKLIATGRLFPARNTDEALRRPLRPLTMGGARPGRIEWDTLTDRRMRPVLRTDPPSTMVLATEPVWYVDEETGEAGTVELSLPFQQLPDYLSMPPISLAEAPLVAASLREPAPPLPVPAAEAGNGNVRVIDSEPVPVMMLNTLSKGALGVGKPSQRNHLLDFAAVSFDYEGVSVKAESSATIVPLPGGNVIHIRRRYDTERQRLLELRKSGLQVVPGNAANTRRALPETLLALPDVDAWPVFVDETLPALAAEGWRVSMASTFRHNVIEIDAIEGTARQAGDGWFDVEMGITVGDRTVRLEPLLAGLFRRDKRWLAGGLESIDDEEDIELITDRAERLRLRAGRLKPVVRVLVDLFEGIGSWKGDDNIRIPELDAGRLAALTDTGRWEFEGDDAIRQLAQRLQSGAGVKEAPVPRGLQAELRTYQHQGLSWMQFLREHNLAGILADDMGLGKTVQTLAHVLAEKEAGRLDRPALIVLPTTLVHNWREEAQRFAPDLKVLDLNGPQRKERFELIGQHELILTTYALLWRDHAVLAEHEYHLLILDEAQYVKNATTKSAAAIRNLRARHRLCLTGTPLENHLGELWAQFDFLLPGFLGTQKDFAKRWRNPIERNGDGVRRELLARRIRPFMLRRRKDEVAKELPQKTTIVRTVDLEGGQRDLYEIVRTAMQAKVRDAVSSQGLSRSHIIVLDALLKLRQVCCDPRLVKLEKASRVKESAKLELLLAMLPELIEEGRRVLLFSQFTGMLELIAAALDKAGIPYVTLTGDTTDRATPVQRFQRGEVPLFLISLKAGGVGLNLTAADTVIHYDPWWNPAAENQATDRAHRLGQQKPVFVYKLIAAGSIEEKIVRLQEKKAALADGILSEDAAGTVKFSDDDLDALFAPMPEIARAS